MSTRSASRRRHDNRERAADEHAAIGLADISLFPKAAGLSDYWRTHFLRLRDVVVGGEQILLEARTKAVVWLTGWLLG